MKIDMRKHISLRGDFFMSASQMLSFVEILSANPIVDLQSQMGIYSVNPGYNLPAYDVEERTAIIPVSGTLVNRLDVSLPWVTGYNYIRDAIAAATLDDQIDTIVLDVDSPGGMVMGAFETARFIRHFSAMKEIRSHIDGMGTSAAYLIPSATGHIAASESSVVGSVGVITTHIEVSKMLEEIGITATIIRGGKNKAEGNPFEPLSDDAKARIQDSVNRTYEKFVSVVSEFRGIDRSVVKNTEASVFDVEKALEIGFIDSIEDNPSVERAMNVKKNLAEGTSDKVAQSDTTGESVKTYQDGVSDERERIMSVIQHEKFSQLKDYAMKLIRNDKLSASEIVELIESVPVVEQASTDPNPFVAAMGSTENPEVGADAPDAEENVLLRDYEAVTGTIN